ncbi:unnamed protein product [Pedinophyceae sp. YPF-701]|nr:unnamed protein product [Pedinophyceae sp. YPF-701]
MQDQVDVLSRRVRELEDSKARMAKDRKYMQDKLAQTEKRATQAHYSAQVLAAEKEDLKARLHEVISENTRLETRILQQGRSIMGRPYADTIPDTLLPSPDAPPHELLGFAGPLDTLNNARDAELNLAEARLREKQLLREMKHHEARIAELEEAAAAAEQQRRQELLDRPESPMGGSASGAQGRQTPPETVDEDSELSLPRSVARKIEELESDLQHAEAKAREEKARRAMVQKQVKDATRAQGKAEEALKALADEKEKLLSQLRLKNEEARRFQEAARAARALTPKQMRDAHAKAQEYEKRLEEMLEKSVASAAAFNAAQQEASAARAAASARDADIAGLRTELAAERDLAERLRKQLEELRGAGRGASWAGGSQEGAGDVQERLRAAEAEVVQLRAELEAARSREASGRSPGREGEETTAEVAAAVEEETAQLRAKVQALQAHAGAAARMQGQVQTLREAQRIAAQSLISAVGSLGGSVARARDAGTWEAAAACAEEHMQLLAAERDAADSRVREVEERAAAAERRCERLQLEVDELRAVNKKHMLHEEFLKKIESVADGDRSADGPDRSERAGALAADAADPFAAQEEGGGRSAGLVSDVLALGDDELAQHDEESFQNMRESIRGGKAAAALREAGAGGAQGTVVSPLADRQASEAVTVGSISLWGSGGDGANGAFAQTPGGGNGVTRGMPAVSPSLALANGDQEGAVWGNDAGTPELAGAGGERKAPKTSGLQSGGVGPKEDEGDYEEHYYDDFEPE